MLTNNHNVIFTTAILASCLTSSAFADQWSYELTPYLFAAGLSGNTGIGPVTAEIDMSFSDIVSNLDSGFMAMFEAQKGKWLFIIDGVYLKVEDEQTNTWQGPLSNSNTTALYQSATEQVYHFMIGHRVLDDKIKLDVLAVERYTMIDATLNFTLSSESELLPDGSPTISGKKSWWEPALAVRVAMPLAEKWTLNGYADIGGFGMGSDMSYQLLAGINWQFAKSATAKIGYRYLQQNFEDNLFSWDVAASGTYLGIGFTF